MAYIRCCKDRSKAAVPKHILRYSEYFHMMLLDAAFCYMWGRTPLKWSLYFFSVFFLFFFQGTSCFILKVTSLVFFIFTSCLCCFPALITIRMSSPVPFSPRCVLGLRLALVGCWVFVVVFLLLYCMIGFVYLFVKTRDCSTGQQKHCPVHPS